MPFIEGCEIAAIDLQAIRLRNLVTQSSKGFITNAGTDAPPMLVRMHRQCWYGWAANAGTDAPPMLVRMHRQCWYRWACLEFACNTFSSV